MSYSFTSIDTTTLPAAMLALAKAHMRVDVAEVDDLITEYVSQAIAYFENFWQLQVFGAEVDFIPDGGAACYPCPVWPVSAFTAADEVGDVTADYVLESTSLTTAPILERVDGAVFPDGVTFSLAVGYAALADLNPAMRGNILRKTAELYEHRESITTESVEGMPSWAGDTLGGLWVPRA